MVVVFLPQAVLADVDPSADLAAELALVLDLLAHEEGTVGGGRDAVCKSLFCQRHPGQAEVCHSHLRRAWT